jgi:hypothetical protein
MLKRLFNRANNEVPKSLGVGETAAAQPRADEVTKPPGVGEIVAPPRAEEVLKKPRIVPRLILGVLGVIVIVNLALAFYWSREPDMFNVKNAALKQVGGDANRLVPGYITAATLDKVANTLLDKPGGYLSNDVMPPSLFLDNIPNWEWGVLVQVRDLARILRNDMSRSQSQSAEDPDLSIADPRFHFNSDSWILPSTEAEYSVALGALNRYLNRLVEQDGQFFPRADNLREWLQQVSKRLGDLANRLSASVPKAEAQIYEIGDIIPTAGNESQPEPQPKSKTKKRRKSTPWLRVDDIFFEARGTTWALRHFLTAIAVDFEPVLQNKNAEASFKQVINYLKATQQPIWSPMILSGRGFGMWANHSLAMASYISRANAGIIDLVNLLAQG